VTTDAGTFVLVDARRRGSSEGSIIAVGGSRHWGQNDRR
jgi:hypothetical protein